MKGVLSVKSLRTPDVGVQTRLGEEPPNTAGLMRCAKRGVREKARVICF